MLTITIGKRTALVIALVLSHWFLYKWAYVKGAQAGIEWMYQQLQAQSKESSGESGAKMRS